MIDVCIPCFSPVYSYGLTPDLYVDRRSRQATEGINYRNLRFPFQNAGARAAGITHGAVHFAAAAESSGADQADFFIEHGGNWTADRSTAHAVLLSLVNMASHSNILF